MIIDLETERFDPTERRYDFCIGGAGVAGITLALKLAAAGKRVALLEGGGEDYSDRSQSIYEGKVTSISRRNLKSLVGALSSFRLI